MHMAILTDLQTPIEVKKDIGLANMHRDKIGIPDGWDMTARLFSGICIYFHSEDMQAQALLLSQISPT